MTDEELEELSGELSEMFSEFVRVEVHNEGREHGVSLVVCTMSYRQKSSDNGPGRRISQTAVVLEADDLDLPQFALAPHQKGIVGKLFSALGGFGDINFDDSPAFSEAYFLHGWAEEPVRMLFTPSVREYFSNAVGWSVRAQRHRLVVFRQNEIVQKDELNEFVRSAMEILGLFREAEQELDLHPEVRRAATGDDIMKTAGQMGLAGSLLANQFKSLAVTQEELDAFHRSSVPRHIPSGVKRQVLGDNLPLVFIGIVFFIAGIVAGGATLAFAPGNDKWIGVPFLVMFPLIGGLMSGLTIRHRRRKARVLRDGELARGTVTKVSHTSTSVNQQVQHRVSVKYQLNGDERSVTCNAYGPAADKAREKSKSGEPVNVLVDPLDANHVVCTDFLMLFSS